MTKPSIIKLALATLCLAALALVLGLRSEVAPAAAAEATAAVVVPASLTLDGAAQPGACEEPSATSAEALSCGTAGWKYVGCCANNYTRWTRAGVYKCCGPCMTP